MISKSPEDTKNLAKKIVLELKNGGTVLLLGDLGSGKTTFAKGFAEALGIKEFNIKSPTYTYIRHLKNSKHHFYHIDLYRLDGKDELLREEIMELINNPANIILVEWADKLFLELNKCIKVFFEYLDENKRKITIQKPNPKKISSTEIKKIYKRFFVPDHLIKHMQKVAKVSEKLSKMAEKKGIKVNKNTIIHAALLHDVMRCVDIQDFKPENYKKNPSVQAKKCWLNIRKKYFKIGHERAMADFLKKIGYEEVANLVAKHGFFDVYKLKTLEEKILYYADKRVERDKIVSLRERLSKGKSRNIKTNDDQKLIKETEQAVFRLEGELSKTLGQNINKL